MVLMYIVLAYALVAVDVHASPPVDSVHTPCTVPGCIDRLIARGIIPEHLADRAYAVGRVVQRVDAPSHLGFQAITQASASTTPLSISASQFIEHHTRTYNRFETVSGLALVVQNVSAHEVSVRVPHLCPVLYRIEDDAGTVMYDRASSRACRTGRSTTIALPAGAMRVFPVEHAAKDFPLRSGTYRFLLTLPGHGTVVHTVTIR